MPGVEWGYIKMLVVQSEAKYLGLKLVREAGLYLTRADCDPPTQIPEQSIA